MGGLEFVGERQNTGIVPHPAFHLRQPDIAVQGGAQIAAADEQQCVVGSQAITDAAESGDRYPP